MAQLARHALAPISPCQGASVGQGRSEASHHPGGQPPVVLPTPTGLGEKSVFYTTKPEAGLRDVLTIECLKINDEVFKGTITYTEATVKIFQQELGLPADLIHSINMSFGKLLLIVYYGPLNSYK